MSRSRGAFRAVLAVFVASLLASAPVRAQAPAPPPAYDAPPPQPTPPGAPPPPPPYAPQPPPPGVYPYGAPPYGATPWPPPYAPPTPPLGGVYVELRADSPNVRIERMAGQLRVPVCYAPCRQLLPRNELYIIAGNGVKPSSRFVLPDDRSQVTLDVQAGSSARVAGGAIMTGLGLITAYVGLLVLTVSSEANAVNNIDNPTPTSNHAAPAGLALTLGGLVVGAIGFGIVLSVHTTVRSSTGSVFTDDAPPPRPRKRPAIALTARGLEF